VILKWLKSQTNDLLITSLTTTSAFRTKAVWDYYNPATGKWGGFKYKVKTTINSVNQPSVTVQTSAACGTAWQCDVACPTECHCEHVHLGTWPHSFYIIQLVHANKSHVSTKETVVSFKTFIKTHLFNKHVSTSEVTANMALPLAMVHNYSGDDMLRTVFMPRCLAVHLVYQLFEDYVG